jgi:hypothetical protein
VVDAAQALKMLWESCQGEPVASETTRKAPRAFRVSDRTRTGDHLDHNQELYQLSYAHRVLPIYRARAWSTKRPRQDSNLRQPA